MAAGVTPITIDRVPLKLVPLKPAREAESRWDTPEWAEREVPFSAETAYALETAGIRVGVVAKVRTTTHRKSGRLITRTFHPTEWVAWLADFHRDREGEWQRGYDYGHSSMAGSRVGLYYRTRADAAEELYRAWLEAREELGA
jgi:hypothetical protein